MNTYDIPRPQPSPDLVDRHLEINNENLLPVISQLPARVDDNLSLNDAALAKVGGSMYRSVDNLLRANQKAIVPIMDTLLSHVDAQLTANDAIMQSLPDSARIPAARAVAAAAPIDPPAPGAAPFVLPGTFVVVFDPDTSTYTYWQAEALPPLPPSYQIVASFPLPENAADFIAQKTGTNAAIDPGVPVKVASAPAPTAPSATGGQSGAVGGGAAATPLPTYPVPGASVTCQPIYVTDPVGQTGWYCASVAGGKAQSIYLDMCDPQEQLAVSVGTYKFAGGPFATQAEADAYCNQGILAPPPPVTQPPPPVTQPPPVTTTQQWFCVRSKDPQGNDLYAALPFDSVLDIASTTWQYVSGPYVDQSTAQTECAKNSTAVTSAPSCPPSSLPPIPDWCSVNVCQTIDQITEMVKGSAAVDLFAALGAGDFEHPAPKGTWLGDIANWPVVGKDLQALIVYATCKMQGLLNVATTATGASAPQFAVVAIARMVVGFLEKWIGEGLRDPRIKLDYWANYLSPTLIPSVGEADALFRTGFIDEQQWRCWVRANNVCETTHAAVVQSSLFHLDVRSNERLYRAGAITDTEYSRYKLWNAIGDARVAEIASAAYTQYPAFVDVIRFMVRDTWDEATVLSGQLDADFEQKYTADAERYGRVAGLDKEVAKLYWRAHWQLPTPSQAYEMLRRLRPGRVDPALTFTMEDARKLLKVADHAPGYIDRLIAVSYRALPIRALRSLYDTDQITVKEVGERYQDQGYAPQDAALFASQEEILKRRRVASQVKGWTPTNIAKAYAQQAITPERASQLLQRLGYSQGDAVEMMDAQRTLVLTRQSEKAQQRVIAKAIQATLRAYESGVLTGPVATSALQSQGVPDAIAPGLLASVDLAVQTRLANQAIAAVRRAYLRGELTAQQADQTLLGAGIAAERALQYVQEWSFQLSPKRRQLTGQQILKATSEGILTFEQARERLNNLGFDQADTDILIAETSYNIQRGELRAKSAADKQRARAATQLMRETQRAQQLAQRTARELCRKTPPSVLVRWFGKELIDINYLTESLTCQGYTPSQIEGYVSDAKDKLAYNKSKGKAPETPPPPLPYDAGQGSGPG